MEFPGVEGRAGGNSSQSKKKWNFQGCSTRKTHVEFTCRLDNRSSGADPEILKREGPVCRPPWLADKENCRFQIV